MESLKTGLVIAIAAIALTGCGEAYNPDPTPQKIDGSNSYEFESDDIDRARNADPAVQDYCADAVSEAQRIGCESHVTPDSPYLNR